MTCSCLPTLRPLVARYFPRLGGSASRSTAGGRYGTGPSLGSYSAKKNQSRTADESQEDICDVALRDMEKGSQTRGARDWADISDDGQSDEAGRTYSVGGPRPSFRTECVGGASHGAPRVPPKDGSGIQVACDIRVTSARVGV